ncbi:MAG: flagellin, partial [Opitutales bacterium]
MGFNKVSLFSEVGTGQGLYGGSVESFNASSESSGLSTSISRHVIDFEDLRYIAEAGEAVKRGEGGLDVIYFPETEPKAQVETITIGGNIAHGDRFYFSIREQTALFKTESDTTFNYLADNSTESAGDPQEVIRDDFYNQLTADANIMNFLDIAKVGPNQLTLTAKMEGDPYLLHSEGSTKTTGSISRTQITANIPNDAKEYTAKINLNGASLYATDTVSLVVNGTAITYAATTADRNNHDNFGNGTDILANKLATKINATGSVNANVGAVGNRRMNGFGNIVYSSGDILLYSKNRGTDFSAGSATISLAAPGGGGATPGTAATFSLTEDQANVVGTKQQFSIKIGADNTADGTGLIGNGNTYTVDIAEKRHADEQDDPYTWWTFDPSSLAPEPRHSVSAAPGATADQIRDQLVNKINASSSLVTASAGASRELILTSREAGEEYSVSVSRGAPDSLTKVVDVPNVSPFSIVKSMNALVEMLSQNGAEQSRLNEVHSNLEGKLGTGEQAIGRMTDTDFAKESTALVKSSLKFEMATQIMSKATRLKDLLIPLTQNHFRSFVLSSTL